MWGCHWEGYMLSHSQGMRGRCTRGRCTSGRCMSGRCAWQVHMAGACVAGVRDRCMVTGACSGCQHLFPIGTVG